MASLMNVESAAKYNLWANNRIYNALKKMSDKDRKENRKAFFKSIHNTMNHILLADLLYRQRIQALLAVRDIDQKRRISSRGNSNGYSSPPPNLVRDACRDAGIEHRQDMVDHRCCDKARTRRS